MDDKIKVFQSFKTFADTEPIIAQLTDEEAGRIFKACYGCYFRGETLAFRSNDDRMFRAAWGTFEMKLLNEREKDSKTSESRSAAGREGGLANAKNRKQKKASADSNEQKEANASTYTDTGTGTNSSTATISSTVTKTKQADADSVSADQPAASAAAKAEPPAGDLFSVKQLLATTKKNKVNLTEEGVRAFYDEMHESGWMLYQKPVEKKGIVKALRGWAKYHLEYGIEADGTPMPDKCRKYLKAWLDWRLECDPNDDYFEIRDCEDLSEIIFDFEHDGINSQCETVANIRKRIPREWEEEFNHLCSEWEKAKRKVKK